MVPAAPRGGYVRCIPDATWLQREAANSRQINAPIPLAPIAVRFLVGERRMGRDHVLEVPAQLVALLALPPLDGQRLGAERAEVAVRLAWTLHRTSIRIQRA